MEQAKRLRILLVAPQPFFEERGTPIAVRTLAETLRDFGHEVDLLVYHCGIDINMLGVRLLRAGRPPLVDFVPIGISWRKLACDLWLVAAMLRLSSVGRYDVIHAVEEALFPAAIIGCWSNHRLVYDMDSSLSEQLTDKWWLLRIFRPLFEALERAAISRASLALPVCDALAAKIRPWIDSDRVIVIPDVPLEGNDMAPCGESLRDLTGTTAVLGLYVGNLERYQGIDLLLEAVALLNPRDAFQMVVIGGTRDSIAHYEKLACDLAIDSRVHFLGPRPLMQLDAYLAQADILVSPRVQGQNTPMKVYSYLHSGKAILATDIRSHTQALDRQTAELVAPEPSAMAAGIARLSCDARRRAELGVAARAMAEREYSMTAYRDRLKRAYALVTS